MNGTASWPGPVAARRRALSLWFAAWLGLLSALAPALAHAQLQAQIGNGRRVALVIGNSAYADALRNPVNDATDMAAKLRGLGFEVTPLYDRNRAQFAAAIRDFGRAAAGADAALFYFAGHGVQVRGRNFLLPVGQRFADEADVETDAVDVATVLARLEEAKARVSLLILDACRTVPLQRASRATARGLARMDAPSGALVAFAAQPGAEALDGSGRNGVFTRYLLEHIGTPGLAVEQVFKRVRADVERETGGRQSPREESSLTADFYFTGVSTALARPAPAPVVTPPAALPAAVPAAAIVAPSAAAARGIPRLAYANLDKVRKDLSLTQADEARLRSTAATLGARLGIDLWLPDSVYVAGRLDLTADLERALRGQTVAARAADWAGATLKFGYVNSDRVLKESRPAKAAQARLEAEFKERDERLKTLAASRGTGDAGYQRERKQFDDDLKRRKEEELTAVVAEGNRHIRAVFDQSGFDLIVQEAVFVAGSIDLTDHVIALLDGRAAPTDALPRLRAAGAPMKLGYIDSDRVLKESALARAAQAKLEAEFQERERKVSALAAARGESDITVQRERKDFREALDRRKNEELARVVELANTKIRAIFNEQKFDLILQDALYSSAGVDITDAVIAALAR